MFLLKSLSWKQISGWSPQPYGFPLLCAQVLAGGKFVCNISCFQKWHINQYLNSSGWAWARGNTKELREGDVTRTIFISIYLFYIRLSGTPLLSFGVATTTDLFWCWELQKVEFICKYFVVKDLALRKYPQSCSHPIAAAQKQFWNYWTADYCVVLHCILDNIHPFVFKQWDDCIPRSVLMMAVHIL